MTNDNFLYLQWQELFKAFNAEDALCLKEYKQVYQAYNSKSRHYHSLTHIEFMLKHALQEGKKPKKNPVLFWSIWLHDVVYSSFAKDNEAKSAEYAAQLLKRLEVNEYIIEQVSKFIIATARHTERNDDEELNFFLDLDLLILGQDEETYQKYSQGVREEYSLIPGPIYRSGRRKMLQRFLESEKIYHCKAFEKYESQARQNMRTELQNLS